MQDKATIEDDNLLNKHDSIRWRPLGNGILRKKCLTFMLWQRATKQQFLGENWSINNTADGGATWRTSTKRTICWISDKGANAVKWQMYFCTEEFAISAYTNRLQTCTKRVNYFISTVVDFGTPCRMQLALLTHSIRQILYAESTTGRYPMRGGCYGDDRRVRLPYFWHRCHDSANADQLVRLSQTVYLARSIYDGRDSWPPRDRDRRGPVRHGRARATTA